MNGKNLSLLICLFMSAQLFCAAADLPGEIKAGVSADDSASSQEAALKAYGGIVGALFQCGFIKFGRVFKAALAPQKPGLHGHGVGLLRGKRVISRNIFVHGLYVLQFQRKRG